MSSSLACVVRCVCLLAAVLLFSQGVRADLSIVGTRFIYPQGLAALSIRVGNLGTAPLLLQTWLDKGDASVDPSRLAVPFVLSPPLSRLDPQQSSVLSLRYSGEPLPVDRESVFWLNFLEVPSLRPLSSNQLSLSYRLRMKLLYRPKGLPGRADEAARQLRWSLQKAEQAALSVSNPTPYYVSLARVDVGDPRQPMTVQGITVEPFGSARLPLSAAPVLSGGAAEIRYQVVLDSGETLSGSVQIHL
ncbi:fimbria/pilus periplasmic chaperone [Pseudomonas sp. BNK-6]|uniref:fimbria/pilus periplasmic chaperone n=1 Tax=Pseudomonas TaxID=286 RepID=UPI001F5DB712|nr:fimbria/pilus periplasmic chaperone [Pseudomonas protegens]BCT31959.1 chaperone CupB4 [Pseudomonas protegens]